MTVLDLLHAAPIDDDIVILPSRWDDATDRSYYFIQYTINSMGKPKRKRPNHSAKQKPHKKRPKKQTCWFDTIEETSTKVVPLLTAGSDTNDTNLTIWVSRALLEDNHDAKEIATERKDAPVNDSTKTETAGEAKPAPLTSIVATTTTTTYLHDTATSEVVSATNLANTDNQQNLVENACNLSPAPSSSSLLIRRVPGCPPAPQAPSTYQRLLPHGDNGDGVVNPSPTIIPNKFWAQRDRLFSRFNEGIQISETEGWYSVTPEAIANHIAQKMIPSATIANSTSVAQPFIIMDAFCGWGGNTIAFAKQPNVLVVAVEWGLGRLKQTARNANVYEIPSDKLLLIHANACHVMSCYKNGKLLLVRPEPRANDSSEGTHHAFMSSPDSLFGYRCGGLELLPTYVNAIFLSPPWGGQDYANNKFQLSRIQLQHHHDSENVIDGTDLLSLALTALAEDDDAGSCVAYFLPRNIDGESLGHAAIAAGYRRKSIELEQQYLQHKFKTVTAYFGSLS